jgi:catechol 2,3-dioxygenase-like lactoylglutathione lyase family enzyme
MDHVGIVVDDLAEAVAFFVELGLELEGETPVQGDWVDRVVGLDAMLAIPDGHGRVELSTFDAPPSDAGNERTLANAPGIRHITFAVEDIDGTVARLQRRGAELIGEVVQYMDRYRLCYLRGPSGIIVELAEQIG